ncbi:MAG TPA: ATP-binding protein [Thermomicrobiaceae bacterium]|nr:ATP-binding protein [Thermomicrobiaceae bacterium]
MSRPEDAMAAVVPPTDGDRHTLKSLIRRLEPGDATSGGPDLWETFLDAIPDAITVQDAAGRVVYANPAAGDLLGFPREATRGRPVVEIANGRVEVVDAQGEPLPLDALPAFRVFHGDPAPAATIRHRRPGGTEGWFVVQARPIVDADGNPVLAVSLFRDVTSQLRTDDALQFLADASALLSSSLDYETTLQQVTQLVVPRLADWCGVSLQRPDREIVQVAVAHVDPAKVVWARELARRFPTAPDSPSGVPRVLRSGQPEFYPEFTDEMLAAAVTTAEQLDIARQVGFNSVMIVPLIARGRTLGALSFVQAESGRHYVPSDLILAQQLADRAALAIDNARLYQEAQDALRARAEFLSIASHELKTPLTAVQGQAQLTARYLEHGQLDAGRLAASNQRLLAGVRRLNLLVNDLLDASRLQTGQLTLRPETVDVVALARDVLARISEQVASSNTDHHRLVLVAPGPVVGRWDPTRLDQVLANLVENAVKYSPGGGEVRVEVHQSVDAVVLVVRDEGIGIAPEDQARLFQPFARAHATEMVPGTGLGLYITRQIVEQHGGTIGVESAPDAGTAFTVRLPLVTETAS